MQICRLNLIEDYFCAPADDLSEADSDSGSDDDDDDDDDDEVLGNSW